MAKIPRVRERTATAEELAEDRRRCLAAEAKTPAPKAGGKPKGPIAAYPRAKKLSAVVSPVGMPNAS